MELFTWGQLGLWEIWATCILRGNLDFWQFGQLGLWVTWALSNLDFEQLGLWAIWET
jgi:hypothetical protein